MRYCFRIFTPSVLAALALTAGSAIGSTAVVSPPAASVALLSLEGGSDAKGDGGEPQPMTIVKYDFDVWKTAVVDTPRPGAVGRQLNMLVRVDPASQPLNRCIDSKCTFKKATLTTPKTLYTLTDVTIDSVSEQPEGLSVNLHFEKLVKTQKPKSPIRIGITIPGLGSGGPSPTRPTGQ